MATNVWAGISGGRPSRRRRKGPEQVEQVSVAQYLDMAIREPWFWTAVDTSTHSKGEAGRKKGMGQKAGLPDIWVMGPASGCTKLILFELKRRKTKSTSAGTLSESQRETIPRLQLAGASVYKVFALEEIVATLQQHGVPMHAALTSTRSIIKCEPGTDG